MFGKRPLGLLVCLAVAFCASTAHGDCYRDLNGHWKFVQTNGYTAELWLTHNGKEIHGQAQPKPHDPLGSVDGTLEGNRLRLTIYWVGGSIGEYTGIINPQGRIEGQTHDRMHSANMAKWHSNRTAPCGKDPDQEKAQQKAKEMEQKAKEAEKKAPPKPKPLVPGLKEAPKPGRLY